VEAKVTHNIWELKWRLFGFYNWK